jgi:hypothetical protein
MASGDLSEGIGGHPIKVALFHLGSEQLAACRVDALADHDERTIEADDDFPRCGADDGLGHDDVDSVRCWCVRFVSRRGQTSV